MGLAILLSSSICNNQALVGGGIFNQGTLVVLGSTVTTNAALLTGGGVANIHGTLVPINFIFDLNDPNNVI